LAFSSAEQACDTVEIMSVNVVSIMFRSQPAIAKEGRRRGRDGGK
jgi:hypothetical protein